MKVKELIEKLEKYKEFDVYFEQKGDMPDGKPTTYSLGLVAVYQSDEKDCTILLDDN